ncbi:hypothetical protein JMA_28840 [Jeotgalibacillus malaysiensis]|uniref:Uncharacterized protein n=1 Tax=Jeotgalibacillus malaysiensis TaxID=1508404 RepID=A0A0B5AQ20_9BACL|nr:hypothetical protein JMA_28840 [Jeotgalibacillus malaysiensis]
MTLLAGVVTRKLSNSKHLVNFLIFLDITLFDSLIETLPFTARPIIAASIFYMFDEIIFHRINLKNHKAKLVFVVPVLTSILLIGPAMFQSIDNELTQSTIDKKGSPSVIIKIDNEQRSIQSQSCWVSTDEICVNNLEPTIIPAHLGTEGLESIPFPEPGQNLSLDFQNSIGPPDVTLHFYQHNNMNSVNEMTIDPDNFTIPEDTPMQIMKVFVRWSNNEQMSFNLGSAGSE